MKTQFMATAIAALVVALMAIGSSWSQDASPPPADAAPRFQAVVPPPANDPFSMPTTSEPSLRSSSYTINAAGAPIPVEHAAIHQLTQKLRRADSDTEKAELTKKLEAAVEKAFDEDFRRREESLVKLEQRMKKLRAQLERRRKAKEEITQLQTKVLINNAEGLGFSDLQPGWPSFYLDESGIPAPPQANVPSESPFGP